MINLLKFLKLSINQLSKYMYKSNYLEIIYLFCILSISCSTPKVNNDTNLDINKDINLELKAKINILSQKLDSLHMANINNNKLINQLINKFDSKLDVLNNAANEIDIMSKAEFENDTSNSESKEIQQIDTRYDNNSIEITNNQFKNKYIDALGFYHSGDFDESLKIFKFLLQFDFNLDLLDNCQYWVGQIYFQKNNFDIAIKEFKKVLKYKNSNKHDDAIYKLSKCYVNIDDNEKADYELNKLVNNYPESEYVKKAKLILNN